MTLLITVLYIWTMVHLVLAVVSIFHDSPGAAWFSGVTAFILACAAVALRTPTIEQVIKSGGLIV